jgi:hypothetical protein
MRKNITAIISLTLLLGIAICAYLVANQLIDGIYDFRSPISGQPPVPGAPVGKPISEKVVHVLIDALRYDTSLDSEVMPYLNKLRTTGASAKMHSQTPSYSAPGYSTIFIGAWPYMHDGPAFNLAYNDIPVWTQDNIFSAAHRNNITTGISAYNWFEKLVPQQDVDLQFYTEGEDNTADEDVVNAALRWLERPGDQYILIHIDQVDYAGHYQGGPTGQGWRDAASRSDALLEKIASSLDFGKDTLIIHSDHGQIDAGGHGGHETVCLTEPFIMVGKGIKPGDYPDVQMVDIAPTVSAILGANFPSISTGHVLQNMLDLPQDYLNAYKVAEESVHANVSRIYSSQVDEPQLSGQSPDNIRSAKLATDRKSRLPFTLAVLIIPPVIVLFKKNKYIKYWIIGAIFTIAIFYTRFALPDKKLFSFSVIDTPTAFISYTAVTTVIAVILGYFALLLFLKPVVAGRMDAARFATGYAYTTIYLLLIPIGWNFLENGFIPTWTLPRLDAYFLGLLAMVVVLIVALIGLLLALASYSLKAYLFKTSG